MLPSRCLANITAKSSPNWENRLKTPTRCLLRGCRPRQNNLTTNDAMLPTSPLSYPDWENRRSAQMRRLLRSCSPRQEYLTTNISTPVYDSAAVDETNLTVETASTAPYRYTKNRLLQRGCPPPPPTASQPTVECLLPWLHDYWRRPLPTATLQRLLAPFNADCCLSFDDYCLG